jgi:hypothetical protein
LWGELIRWVLICVDVGKRIDDIEKSINDIMNELGDEEDQKNMK